jgi:fibronectin-binding autotransporter adhesin
LNLVAANTITGDTTLRTGAKLVIGNNLALQNSALDVGSSGGTFALAAGSNGGRITGETAATSPTFGGLKGTRNLSSAFTASSGGNNETNLAATAVTSFTLNVGSGKTCTDSGVIANFAAGTTLTKTGPGTQTLTGANTYTGATNVNQGKWFINGNSSAATGNMTVAAAATLGGTGTIGGNTTIAATGKLEFDLSTAAASAVPAAGFRTVVVSIPKTLASGGKLFAHLRVVVTP